MNVDEIREKLKEKGWSIAEFARRLGVGYSTLQTILSGRNPLTRPMERLINYELNTPREHIVIYKVSIPDDVVETLTPQATTPAEKERILKNIVRANLEELAQLGAILSSDELTSPGGEDVQ